MKTDDRLAVAVGLVLWVLMFGAALVAAPLLPDGLRGTHPITTCTSGIVLGLLGLLYTSRRR